MRAISEFFKKNKVTILVIFAIFILDRLTKALTLGTIAMNGPKEIFKYFSFTYAENTGMAFSMFQNGNTPLIFVMLAVLAFVFYSWEDLAKIKKPWSELGLAFITGGALGNLYDRVFLGYVVDMLDFKVWPVFNAADSFICIGAGLVFLAMLLGKKESKQ